MENVNQKVLLYLGEGQTLAINVGPLADLINEIGTNPQDHCKQFAAAIDALMDMHSKGEVSAEEILDHCTFLKAYRCAIAKMDWQQVQEK
jgi:hypothetical protein